MRKVFFHFFKKKKNIIYVILPLSVVFIAASFLLRKNTNIQIEIIFLAAFVYISLAFLHHYFDKSLNLETIIDYILIALLSVIILTGVLV